MTDTYAQHVGCDDKDHDGYMLADSSVCDIPELAYKFQYYTSDSTIWFNMTMTEGSDFVINSTACSSALGTVLNDCAPYTASSLATLEKYGGSITVNNGTGGVAVFSIDLQKLS